MTKHTPARRVILLAIRTTLFLALASTASASALAKAQEARSNHLPGGSFMQIHMDNQKIGSAVRAYWEAHTPPVGANVVAKQKPLWERQTDSAYFTVFGYHCAPGMLERAAGAVEPNGIEVALYTEKLRVEYDGDCRAFYLNEVAVRIDPQALADGWGS